ncbi:uncharacterized protein EKO05_0000062 [Ascochyta rabiei]|nr:uncharacterized protein EKO05_0000062 [Ascochyta rabiei]UPX09372.1 hypothetical protein EKO05_0000062 [Ascochyta rabiei]
MKGSVWIERNTLTADASWYPHSSSTRSYKLRDERGCKTHSVLAW